MPEESFGSGLVDLLVLGALDGGESYGYAIAQALADAGAAGLSEATIYACLKRLHDRGLLSSRQVVADNGKARRYYALTRTGSTQLVRERASWVAMKAAVDEVLAKGE